MVATIYRIKDEPSFSYRSVLFSLCYKKLVANSLDFSRQILTYRDLPYIKIKEISRGFQGAL